MKSCLRILWMKNKNCLWTSWDTQTTWHTKIWAKYQNPIKMFSIKQSLTSQPKWCSLTQATLTIAPTLLRARSLIKIIINLYQLRIFLSEWTTFRCKMIKIFKVQWLSHHWFHLFYKTKIWISRFFKEGGRDKTESKEILI